MRSSWNRDALLLSRNSYPSDGAPQCYNLTSKDLESMHVAQAGVFLRPEEIAAVAEYVISSIKGKGDPNLADCIAFFGEELNACEVYKGEVTMRCRRPRQRSDRRPRLRARPAIRGSGSLRVAERIGRRGGGVRFGFARRQHWHVGAGTSRLRLSQLVVCWDDESAA